MPNDKKNPPRAGEGDAFSAVGDVYRNLASAAPPLSTTSTNGADLLAEIAIVSAHSRQLVDALCASLCFARRRVRLAKCALRPAVCLTTANRSADGVRPGR